MMETYRKEDIRRGDIYYADLRPVVGSEQGGIRPVVILQNNVGNRHSPTVIAAAITSRKGKHKLPTHVNLDAPVPGLYRDSIRDKAVCALCGEKMARDTKSRGRPRWRCKNPECGGSVYLDDSIILERVVQKLKVLAHSPECIRLPKAAPASTDALRIENELALCFNRADINPEYMKTLIMAAAAERYAGLNDPTPAHRRALLRQKLELEPENEETLWELFESAVTHVCIGKGGEISLSQKDQKECAS